MRGTGYEERGGSMGCRLLEFEGRGRRRKLSSVTGLPMWVGPNDGVYILGFGIDVAF